MKKFADRRAAGRLLGEQCLALHTEAPIVLGLPRGGVPVAFEVAQVLDAPLDVVVVRKLGHPRQPELAVGAIGEGGVRVLNEETLIRTGVTREQLAAVEARERAELARRVARYRAGRDPIGVAGRNVFVVDDGIATGATMSVACAVVRELGARRIIVATPVISDTASALLAGQADEIVAVRTPSIFQAVGAFYREFTPTGDAEVVSLLERAQQPHAK